MSLGRTLSAFIVSILIMGLTIFVYVYTGTKENLVMLLSCSIFIGPFILLTGWKLIKMWINKTTTLKQ